MNATTTHAAIGMLLGGLLLAAPSRSNRQEPEAKPPSVVVGTYDSRALVLAYVGSKEFAEYLAAQKRDVERAVERAKVAGDRDLLADLQALGPAMQERIHRQGFAAAPAGDILARIQAKLPALAKQAGVDLIVCKWDLAWRDPNAQVVDVSERMAALFDPDPKTWKSIREIMAKDPVPLDQLPASHK